MLLKRSTNSPKIAEKNLNNEEAMLSKRCFDFKHHLEEDKEEKKDGIEIVATKDVHEIMC